jgi:putative spermidine/putrescine transport system ATP-binding protein
MSFVHVTHSQEEAMALADLVVVMNHGRIEQAGSAREVFDAPAHRVRGALHRRAQRLRHPGGKVAVRSDRMQCARRPGRLCRHRRHGATAIEYQGTQVQVHLV